VKWDEATTECERCVKSYRICYGYAKEVPGGEGKVGEEAVKRRRRMKRYWNNGQASPFTPWFVK
jgi:hypothetical protein